MRHGSLFSGIGGFDLAVEWMGWENVFQVEWDTYCQKVLAKNFPNVKRYGEIKEFDGTKYRGLVDIISGGFPCQPFSQAGKRKGKSDDRYLWPEMLRVIGEIRPSFIVGENVGGIWSMVDKICNDLEGQGYKVEPFDIAACSVGTDHIRERYWFLAYSQGLRRIQVGKNKQKRLSNFNIESCNEAWGYSSDLLHGMEPDWSNPSSGIIRNDDGLSEGVDRLKGLGNAIVPQVAYQIFKAIEEFNLNNPIFFEK